MFKEEPLNKVKQEPKVIGIRINITITILGGAYGGKLIENEKTIPGYFNYLRTNKDKAPCSLTLT